MTAAIAAQYRRFAEQEADGRSPLYAALARGVAEDAALLGFLAALPEAKRQPNLLLGAVRHLHGVARDFAGFRTAVLGDAAAVRALMLARATQTNEAGRCAVLLPLLAQLPGPLAILEVGASAGLCLLPDCYGYDYDYGGHVIAGGPPVLDCAASGGVPLPAAVPEIVWRAGLDLAPVDAAETASAAWLESLVWPEQAARAARLRAALAVARRVRPRLVRGDLVVDLAALAAEMPRGATRVIFHTAVLSYVAPERRARFAAGVRDLCDVWISNEAPRVFPAHAAGIGAAPAPGRFVLARDGRAVAWTDPHGAAMEWIGG